MPNTRLPKRIICAFLPDEVGTQRPPGRLKGKWYRQTLVEALRAGGFALGAWMQLAAQHEGREWKLGTRKVAMWFKPIFPVPGDSPPDRSREVRKIMSRSTARPDKSFLAAVGAAQKWIWGRSDFEDVFAAVMSVEPWVSHLSHEMDLCLFRFVGMTAHARALDCGHLDEYVEALSNLLPQTQPVRRRLRAKQRRPEAFEKTETDVPPPPEPEVPRVRGRYWAERHHSNRDGAMYACPILGCQRKYTTQHGLGHRLILSHRSGTYREKGWDCPHCCRSFERESAITSHLKLHSPDASPYICPECGAYFPGRDSVRMHMSHAHPLNQDMLPITCSYCLRAGVENVFAHLHSFRMHLLRKHIQ